MSLFRADSSRHAFRQILAASAAAASALALAACSGPSGTPTGATLRAARSARNFRHLVNHLLPSVVEITAGDSIGSGVVFDAHGDIVTNEHVIGNHTSFEVQVSAQSQPMPARLIGQFAPDDLAVIRVTRDAKILRPVHWADSGQVAVGDFVLALGSPYGLIDSITQGIVSSTGRTIAGPGSDGRPPPVIVNAIQTSAAINPGNSGGALVLLSGAVIGIPTLSATDPDIGSAAPGISFAIPSNTVISIARQLIQSGKVTRSGRATLGITGRTVTTSGSPSGVAVDRAPPASAAARAGIRDGDVIAGVDGHVTPTITDLELTLAGLRPGARATVEISRNGNPRQVTATLGTLRR